MGTLYRATATEPEATQPPGADTRTSQRTECPGRTRRARIARKRGTCGYLGCKRESACRFREAGTCAGVRTVARPRHPRYRFGSRQWIPRPQRPRHGPAGTSLDLQLQRAAKWAERAARDGYSQRGLRYHPHPKLLRYLPSRELRGDRELRLP